MKILGPLLALLLFGGSGAPAGPDLAEPPARNRPLFIDPSSMPISGGTATLTIGLLHRTNGVYSGDYKVSIFPYFFKNDEGRLAIVVPDASLDLMNAGKIATVVGTATTNNKDRYCRHVDAIAVPQNANRGALKLWFMAGDRKMIFEPTYHFAEKE